MNILVCVKQVPDVESVLKVNADGDWIEESNAAFRMNEYDEFAVEQSVRIKEQLSGTADITVLSIGPARATEVIKKAMAMGADRGVHIRDEHSHKKDPWQIAAMIAAFARTKAFDIIFTGMQSQDRGSAQVGVFVAGMLGLPCVTTVVRFTLDGKEAAASRELEGGVKMNVTFALPAVVTCQLGLTVPRYPTLPNIMKAKQKELLTIPAADMGAADGRVRTTTIYRPERKTGGIVLEGDPREMADRLVTLLKTTTTVVR